AIRVEAGVRTAAPVVEEWVGSSVLPGRALRLLGVDVFAEGAIRPELTADRRGDAGLDVAPLLTRSRAVFLSGAAARDAGVDTGDPLPVEVAGRTDTLRVAGIFSRADGSSGEGVRDLLVVDVATAQELLDRAGRITRIDLAIPEGESGLLQRVRSLLPPDARLEETGARTRSLSEMIRAFDLNLQALGLLALLFGGFLIYNTVSFSVVQRRELLGRLRALGVTRREIFGLILSESAVVGVVGGALGVGLGILLGRGLVDLVTRTINDLYFVVSVEGVTLSSSVLAKGWFLGVATTLVAAVPAVWEALSTPPRATLTRSFVEERVRSLVPRLAWTGLALSVAGGLLLLVPSRSVVLGFASLFGLVLGFALMTPLVTAWSVGAALPAIKRGLGILGALAARGVSAALSRTGPAAAALVVAVSVTVGLGVMISSFRTSVATWLDATLQGDVYVSVPSPVSSRPEGTLDPELVRRLTSVNGVEGVTRYRNVELQSRYGPIRLVAVAPAEGEQAGVQLLSGSEETARIALGEGEGVLLSEPLAFRTGLEPGSTLTLGTALGERSFQVAGIYRDYGSEQGVVMMNQDLYRRLWRDPGVSSLALYAGSGVAPDILVRRVQEAAATGS
ncbi:MAG: ABC transporter permease, partial [Longimicrobiales bacterium]|nr:ABC transporter permease [Longimicrobiales bacterium]